MDAPQLFHRCMRQVFARPTRCGNVLNIRRDILPNRQQLQPNRPSSRSFTVTTRSLQDGSPRSQSNPQDSDRPEEKQPVRTAPQQPSSQSYDPNDSTRIDLSSLEGIPADYVAPKRPGNPEKAAAQLKALFEPRPSLTSKPNATNTSTTPASSTSTSTTPSLDVYNVFKSSKPSRRGGFDNHQMKNLINNLTNADNPAFKQTEGPPALRLRPTLGRTLEVGRDGRGIDLTRAFRMLEMKCNANSVKSDARNQRFHVRRGQRLKLERKARWRVLFREGFLDECARVRKMMRQGW